MWIAGPFRWIGLVQERMQNRKKLMCTARYVSECTCNRTGKEMKVDDDLAGKKQGRGALPSRYVHSRYGM